MTVLKYLSSTEVQTSRAILKIKFSKFYLIAIKAIELFWIKIARNKPIFLSFAALSFFFFIYIIFFHYVDEGQITLFNKMKNFEYIFFLATRKSPKDLHKLIQFSIDGFFRKYHKEALKDIPEDEY